MIVTFVKYKCKGKGVSILWRQRIRQRHVVNAGYEGSAQGMLFVVLTVVSRDMRILTQPIIYVIAIPSSVRRAVGCGQPPLKPLREASSPSPRVSS